MTRNLDLQIDSLKGADCTKIFRDKLSCDKSKRPGLHLLIQTVRKNDTVIVCKLDRLGRSLKDLIEIITTLNEKGVISKSLTENIDTTTASGKLIFDILSSLAEFERSIITERINAGIASARTRGKALGRKKGLSPEAEKKSIIAASLYQQDK